MDGEIDAASLEARLAGGEDDPLVIDIRSPGEFRREHIPGSRNVPLGDLPTRIEVVDGAEHVVTVCPHGEASIQAARLVSAYGGFDGTVESLAGGLEAWAGPLSDGSAEGGAGDGGAGDGDSAAEADVETAGDRAEASDAADEPSAPF